MSEDREVYVAKSTEPDRIALPEKARATVAAQVARLRELDAALHAYLVGVREALNVPEEWVLDVAALEKGFGPAVRNEYEGGPTAGGDSSRPD